MKTLSLFLLLFATACSASKDESQTINRRVFKRCSTIKEVNIGKQQLKYIQRSSRPYHFPGLPFDDNYVCFVRRDFDGFSVVRISYPQLNHHGTLWYVGMRKNDSDSMLVKMHLTNLDVQSFIELKKTGVLLREDWKDLHKKYLGLDSVSFKEAAMREFDIGL